LARDWVDIALNIEGRIPQAIGGTDRDDTLRSLLVPFANNIIDEIDREQRWSLSYAEPTFTTVAGTQNYAIPYPSPAGPVGLTSPLTLARLYYTDANGRIVRLERTTREEAQRLFGEANNLPAGATSPVRGAPTKFSIEPVVATTAGITLSNPQLGIYLYPTPDDEGPESGGNYKIRVGGYWKTPPIFETLGNTATSTTLTFTTAGSGSYLSAAGLPTSGADYNLFVSVRGAGNQTGVTALGRDTHICSWSALAANSVTLSVAAPSTTTSCQTFFCSTNWMILSWPNLLVYGVMKEIMAYFNKPELTVFYQTLFDRQMDKLRGYEFDRQRGNQQHAAVQTGQTASMFRRQDQESYLDIRGSG
jgi:hypothetical protein